MNSGRPQGRRELLELLERHGRRPNKRLGQHFLADPNLVDRIVRLAHLEPGDRVVEVGAGTGTLTRALHGTGATVVTYEIDRGLQPVLAESLVGLDVDVRFDDVTAVDLDEALDDTPWTMVANLPYQMGTPLLLDTLRSVERITRFVVMIQREVADRLAARPGSKEYGSPSVSAALRSRVQFGFAVPPQVFVPAPAVESAVVTLERIETVPGVDRAEQLAAVAFQQRRKMVRGSLRSVIEPVVPLLEEAGIDPTSRAEDLSPADYLRLAHVTS